MTHQYSSLLFFTHQILLHIRLLFVMIVSVNEHETIVKLGGIEMMVQLLKIFSADTEIVHVIFQIFVTLMYEDEKKMKRKRTQNQTCMQSKITHHTNQPGCSKNRNTCFYRTARRIHLVGYAKDLIVHLLEHYQDKHDDIRILGKSIVKDLIKTESHVAMETLRYVYKNKLIYIYRC